MQKGIDYCWYTRKCLGNWEIGGMEQVKQEITEQKYSRNFGIKLKAMIVFVIIVGLGVAAYHYYTAQKTARPTKQTAGAPAVDVVTLKPQNMVRTS